MSWSVLLVGKPDNIVAALEFESGKLTGNCKEEFDGALPGLILLVRQNFQDRVGPGYGPPTLTLEASGSGTAENGKHMNRECQVKLGRSAHKGV